MPCYNPYMHTHMDDAYTDMCKILLIIMSPRHPLDGLSNVSISHSPDANILHSDSKQRYIHIHINLNSVSHHSLWYVYTGHCFNLTKLGHLPHTHIMLIHNITMSHHPSRNSFPRAKIHCYCHTSKTKVRTAYIY